MNKGELTKSIAEKAEVSKLKAAKALEAFIEEVTKALKTGDQVALVGFGTFKLKHRPARVGRNPRTKAPLDIPAANKAAFTAGTKLKAAVNKK
ncbi:MAG: HU family DNA-binding protein [Pseudomonas capeferrum]|jgi:nucleoid DNA-binding protein|uniref:HU family DNA-binding protein n=1 Tax=unclassified Pseudomonas TaxID=196821 RepID=UPI002363787B|nr:HU family DNA-binding protein [Pseudomonas sp. 39004]MDD1962615.1 HU family DNA-binding protein [Pseudomonas sp. 39004]